MVPNIKSLICLKFKKFLKNFGDEYEIFLTEKCNDVLYRAHEPLYRLRIYLYYVTLVYSIFQRFYLFFNHEKLDIEHRFLYYDHHSIIFGSCKQYLLLGSLFCIFFTYLKPLYIDFDKYLVEIFLKIYSKIISSKNHS